MFRPLSPVFRCLPSACLALLLGGCIGAYTVPSLQRPNDGHFEVDTRRFQLCYMPGGNCQDLGLIVGSFEKDRVLRAYGLPPWRWSRLNGTDQLVRLMLEPPDQAYPVTQVGERRYRLPVTPATYEVWDLLGDEYRDRYLQDDDCRLSPFAC